MWLALPVAFGGAFLVVYQGLKHVRRCFRMDEKARIAKLSVRRYITVVRLVYTKAEEMGIVVLCGILRSGSVMYPVIMSRILRLAKCHSMEDGSWVMEMDYSVPCYDERWKANVGPFAFAFVVVGLGWPYLMFRLLRSARERNTLFDPDAFDCKILWPYTVDFKKVRSSNLHCPFSFARPSPQPWRRRLAGGGPWWRWGRCLCWRCARSCRTA